jgi:hypothetical protein
MKKKWVTALIVVVVLLVLIWVANILVSSFDFAGFIKSLHGG